MLELGEIRRASELGYKTPNAKFIYAACEGCGVKRWVHLVKGEPHRKRCKICGQVGHPEKQIDENKLRELYSHYWSQQKIAEFFSVSKPTIERRLKKLNISKPPGAMKGSRNPAWKGGRHKLKSGYIVVYKPDHLRAMINKGKPRFVYEHILVWEEANGRSLPDGWVVHHINGKRDDNRPENLLGLPKKSHNYALRLKAQQKRIRQLESEVKKLKTQQVMVL